MIIICEISGSDCLCNDRPFSNGFRDVIPQQATERFCFAIGPQMFSKENGIVLFREDRVARRFSTI
jgi:hypothetical protein